MNYELEQARNWVSHLPPGLLAHCQRTSQVCLELARRFGCPAEKAQLAGLVHDLARDKTEAELLSLAGAYRLAVGPLERRMPLLLHGPLAARILQKDLGITDRDVLQAVASHTTGRSRMSLLAKIVFLGDKIELGKSQLYPDIHKVRELAQSDLDRALLEFFDWQIKSLMEGRAPIHPATLAARNHLLLSINHPT